MNEIEINKLLHEARGLCWHKGTHTVNIEGCVWVVCPICNIGDMGGLSNPSYTRNWSDYGPLLEWVRQQSWWWEFINDDFYNTIEKIINPLTGSTALAEFLKEKETKNV